jgi:hypothetical protein
MIDLRNWPIGLCLFDGEPVCSRLEYFRGKCVKNA